jgi:hypothetical protein
MNKEDLRYEEFCEKFAECSTEEKIAMLQEYYENNHPDDMWYDFDEEFFEMAFRKKPYEAARATYFGNIRSWRDEYIRFDRCGNLESAHTYDVEQEADDCRREIYEEDCWHDYIELEADEEKEEEEGGE